MAATATPGKHPRLGGRTIVIALLALAAGSFLTYMVENVPVAAIAAAEPNGASAR